MPDVPAVDRAFDYLVPDELAEDLHIGTVVRVPLHGRRVRGWVLATDVTPEAEVSRLLPVRAVVSAGPPADVVDLCLWAAWRWAGPRASLLRVGTPSNIVPPGPPPEPDAAVHPAAEPPVPLSDEPRRSIRWPPGTPRAELIHALIASEGSTIVVAPDAHEHDALAATLEREGRPVLRWERDHPGADQTAAWMEARRGACVILGGRAAAFAPVPDLRAAIVLDDADEALKEERAPSWHARDVLAERASRVGARFDLVTPAPTPEALSIVPTAPVVPNDERGGWPRIEVVDPRDDPPGTGLLSQPLATALHHAMDTGGHAICVLNRRGRARLLACRTCDELARCARCDAAVVEASGRLTCPRCGLSRGIECLHDGGIAFRVVKPGVGRAREELAALAPRARVIAVDTASAPLPAFDVAVGTAAVLHRVRGGAARPVTLVAFLEFDQELLAPRYRAAEQALWLLVRAARVVGPRAQGGLVVVQTRLPADPVVTSARAGDPTAVVTAEQERRALLRFPPFGGLAELAGVAPAVDAACVELRHHVEVLGPESGRALLRAPTMDALCDALDAVDLSSARSLGRLRVDVDPLRV